MKTGYKLLPAIIITFTGCIKQPGESVKPVISMQKTACYGACPVYSIEIFADYTVIYSGEENVPVKGQKKFKMEKAEFDKLVAAFEQSNFFKFKSDYMAPVKDLPTTHIEFNYQGESKKIRDYYGAPEELKQLENRVEEFVRNKIWETKK